MTTKSLTAVSLLIDSCHGVYVPQRFINNFDLSLWQGISEENKNILSEGPDHEWYWEEWDEVLQRATFTQDGHTWRLVQDGDLWAFCHELMTDEEKHNFGMDE